MSDSFLIIMASPHVNDSICPESGERLYKLKNVDGIDWQHLNNHPQCMRAQPVVSVTWADCQFLLGLAFL